MTETTNERLADATVELVTFYLGGALYGVDILKVQEINKLQAWTPVPHSEDFILGILSLRGSIVTIIDLGKKLGLEQTVVNSDSRTIIVNAEEQCVGFLVDRIGSVAIASRDQVCDPPANVNTIHGDYLQGVYKTDGELITLLDIEAVFRDVDTKAQV